MFRGTIALVGYENTETIVFANQKPIARTEFFAAGQSPIRPELMFEVRTAEYSDQKRIRHNGKTYAVYRVYPRDGGVTELYCEVRLGGN